MSSPSSSTPEVSNRSYVTSFSQAVFGAAKSSPEKFIDYRGRAISFLPTRANNALAKFQNSSFLKKCDAYGLNNQNLLFIASLFAGLTLASKYPEWTIVPAATIFTFVPTHQALKAAVIFGGIAFGAACVVNHLAANDIYEP